MNFLIKALKTVWLLFWTSFALIIVFLPVMIFSIFSKTGNLAFKTAKIWAWITIKATGVKLHKRNNDGVKNDRSYIIIANHQSLFDGLAIALTLKNQFRWIAKKELKWVPLFGYALYATRNIFVDRSNLKKSIESINRGFQRLPGDVSILFFAEGSRSGDGKVKEFKKGGFFMAVENGIPILPITVNGSRKVLKKGDSAFNSGPIEVVVGDVIETAGLNTDDLDDLIKKTRDIIISNLDPHYPAEKPSL
ncbi:lysophospholipid acyltransferase family protein [Spirochaetota bacterium]